MTRSVPVTCLHLLESAWWSMIETTYSPAGESSVILMTPPCLSLLKNLLKVQGGCHQMSVSPTAKAHRLGEPGLRAGWQPVVVEQRQLQQPCAHSNRSIATSVAARPSGPRPAPPHEPVGTAGSLTTLLQHPEFVILVGQPGALDSLHPAEDKRGRLDPGPRKQRGRVRPQGHLGRGALQPGHDLLGVDGGLPPDQVAHRDGRHDRIRVARLPPPPPRPSARTPAGGGGNGRHRTWLPVTTHHAVGPSISDAAPPPTAASTRKPISVSAGGASAAWAVVPHTPPQPIPAARHPATAAAPGRLRPDQEAGNLARCDAPRDALVLLYSERPLVNLSPTGIGRSRRTCDCIGNAAVARRPGP